MKRSGIPIEQFPETYVRTALQTCETKINTFDELAAYAGFYFTDQISYPPEAATKQFTPENLSRLQAVRDAFGGLTSFSAADVEGALRTTASELGVKLGALVHPTRLAVTGSTAGPSLYHLLEVLGRTKVVERINAALSKAGC
jgi:glutamyl-tRNA synthetase